jgi:hypothetical protein
MLTSQTSFVTIVSFPEDCYDATAPCLPIARERRSKSRYPLHLKVRFRSISGPCSLSGAGHTVNLSACGVLIVVQDMVPRDEISAGVKLEISVEWPVLLDERIPLQLLAVGRVVRRGATDFAVAFRHHQFRTMGKPRADAGAVRNAVEIA